METGMQKVLDFNPHRKSLSEAHLDRKTGFVSLSRVFELKLFFMAKCQTITYL